VDEVYPDNPSADVRPAGEGWPFFCVRCQESGTSLAPGICPRCGGSIADEPPSVPMPDQGRRRRGRRATLGSLLGHPLEAALALSLALLIVVLIFSLYGIYGLPPALLVLILLGLALSDQSDLLSSFEGLGEVRGFFALVGAEVSRTRQQTSIVLHVHCEASSTGGSDIDLIIRLRGPDRHYLRASRPLYAGDLGELRLWHTLPRPARGGGAPVNSVVRIPLGLLHLPAAYEQQRVDVEVLFVSAGKLLAAQEAEAFLHLPPRPGRELRQAGPASHRRSRDLRLPTPRVERPGELQTMRVPKARLPLDARCGICSDELQDPVVVCRRCETPMHRQCWSFTGGCATYGCGPVPPELDEDLSGDISGEVGPPPAGPGPV